MTPGAPRSTETAELVDRIWSRDPTVWTGGDEGNWLGWLDEPWRMEERLKHLPDLCRQDFTDVVLLGMGGSSLAPEVLRRTFDAQGFHVLDTTHPRAIRALEERIDVESTLFVAASKSGGTIETRVQLDYFQGRGGAFAAITDPGSSLDRFARENGALWIAHGEPTIGGRYSALSPFGMVPALLMGLQVGTLLERAREAAESCRAEPREALIGNPGFMLGRTISDETQAGRDKLCLDDSPSGNVNGLVLWLEQLLAESTGKDGIGVVPAPYEDPHGGPDRWGHEISLDDPYDLGGEFFTWEFATAVAGSFLGINPFDQPDVQAAKDRTNALLERGGDIELERVSSVDDLLAQAREGDYVAIQAFIDPAREAELQPLAARARETGCAATVGLGPRYLHSTGQLHKGGPNTVLALQVVDDFGDEVKIPGRDFGFRRLLSAQAAGDLEALRERGRRVARVKLGDI